MLGKAAELSDAFEITRGGIQGGMSTPLVYSLCASEIVAEDDARRQDLDFEIRRECLRLECLSSGGERWMVDGAERGWDAALDVRAADEGQWWWNQGGRPSMLDRGRAGG
jgi:hypothetical protein